MFKILRALNGHSQNRSLDEEASVSRKNYIFDQVRSPYSVLMNTSALVPFYLFILIILVALVNNVKFKNTFKFCKLALKFFLSFPSIFLNKLHYSFHGNYYHGESY